MFGRCRPCAAGTDGIPLLGIIRHCGLQAESTVPLRVGIVDVAETLPRLEAKTLEGDVPSVRRIAAIVFAKDVEMVEVFIAPRKQDLEHAMEVRQGGIA